VLYVIGDNLEKRYVQARLHFALEYELFLEAITEKKNDNFGDRFSDKRRQANGIEGFGE